MMTVALAERIPEVVAGGTCPSSSSTEEVPLEARLVITSSALRFAHTTQPAVEAETVEETAEETFGEEMTGGETTINIGMEVGEVAGAGLHC